MTYLILLLYVTAIYLRPGEIVPGWAGFPFVKILALMAVVSAVIAYRNEPRRLGDLPHDTFLLGLWATMVASSLVSGWPGDAYRGVTEFFKIVFYYFLMRFAVREAWHFRVLLVLLIVLTVVQAANGIVQYHTGVGLGDVGLLRGRIQGTGIFNNPNDLALALLMVVPLLAVDLLARDTRPVRRLLGALALAPILVAIHYTGSRGGFVALAVTMVAVCVYRFGPLVGGGVAAAGLVVLVVLAPARVHEISPHATDARSRIEAWGKGLELFGTRPLLGVGYRRFTDYHAIVAHNSFVHTFAELGIVGTFFAVGMGYWFFRGLRAGDRPDPTNGLGHWRRALAISGVSVITAAAFLSRQYDPILYTLLGLGACHVAIGQSEPARLRLRSTPRDFAIILALTGGGILLTWAVVRALA